MRDYGPWKIVDSRRVYRDPWIEVQVDDVPPLGWKFAAIDWNGVTDPAPNKAFTLIAVASLFSRAKTSMSRCVSRRGASPGGRNVFHGVPQRAPAGEGARRARRPPPSAAARCAARTPAGRSLSPAGLRRLFPAPSFSGKMVRVVPRSAG